MKRGPIYYSEDERAFIYDYRDLPRKELHAEFVAKFGRTDLSVAHIKAFCTRAGWTTGRGKNFSPTDDALLRERFADTPTTQLAQQLQRSYGTVAVRARTLGLRKSAEYLTSRASGRLQRGDRIGAATCFQPGHAPKNKGVKRPAGWSPGRISETQFAKGSRAWNLKPIGSVRVVDGYEFVKVSDAPMVAWTENWRQTHIVNWESVHGPLPEGMALKSLDGNRRNTAPANWVAIPRAIMPRLSSGLWNRQAYDHAPDELKPVILATAKLAHALKQRKAAKGAA